MRNLPLYYSSDLETFQGGVEGSSWSGEARDKGGNMSMTILAYFGHADKTPSIICIETQRYNNPKTNYAMHQL